LKFTVPARPKAELPTVSLRPDGIRQALNDYPDQAFVDILCNIATYGTRIGYEGSTKVRVHRANHGTAYSNAQVVTNALQKELEKGRLRILDSLPPHYYCSPIGLVPKKSDGIQTGWRIIFDLSCPEGHSVNDEIPKDYGTISYEPLTVAMEMVAKMGRNAVMMKRDLKSAFRYIPVSPEDYWCLIFEWQGKYYVDLFLPFGLRTAPRIFNLFSEAIHWILESLHWSVTHYLDDFFIVFPPGSDMTGPSRQFDNVLDTIGLIKAPEKDESGTTVNHLGFEFDSAKMEVRLPPNKLRRAQLAVEALLVRKSVSQSSLEEILGFLSHCCQVVPLGRPFLRQLFSLLQRKARFRRARLSSSAKSDLRWWQLFLSHWSSISLLQLSRSTFDVATDASGLKGIGGIYNNHIFSSRVPSRHRTKHINWKEMFAILHALILWHKEWIHGSVDIACDNTAVVNGINNRSIRGPAIRPLRTILLIAAVFDIEIKAHWISSEENVIADAASRHDFKKLANLGFKDQVSTLRSRPSPAIKVSVLRQQLKDFFISHSLPRPERTTSRYGDHMSHSATTNHTAFIRPLLRQSRTGSHLSQKLSERSQLKVISTRSDPITQKKDSTIRHSPILVSNLSSKEQNDITGKANEDCDFHLQTTSSKGSLLSSPMTLTDSISKQQYVQASQGSFAQENSHGKHGTHIPLQDITWQGNIYDSMQTDQLRLPFQHQKLTHSRRELTSISQLPLPVSVQPPPYVHYTSAFQPNQTHRRSVGQQAHSRRHTLSKKSEKTFLEPASRHKDTQATHYGKAQQSQHQRKASRERKSNSLADGKVTQSIYTSTMFPNPPLPPIFSL
jgi:hypothetical protein